MVIDSSALIAILLNEPEADRFATAICRSRMRIVGAVSQLETGMVLAGRYGAAAVSELAELMIALEIQVVPFSADQAERALDAFLRFGKGRGHPARLNFGDCCSYALARHLDLPLLYKGDDFRHTDLVPAPV